MKRLVLACWTPILGTALVLGCGSDADDSPSEALGDKAVSELTNEEARSLCVQNQSKFDQAAQAACTLQGIIDNFEDVAGCEADRDACLADFTGSVDCSQTDVSDVGSCTLTVGELEGCLNQLLTWVTSLTCATTQLPDPPACAEQLQMQCAFGE